MQRILFPVGPTPPKQVLDNVMNIANQIHQNVRGCEMLPKLAEQLHCVVMQDILGWINARIPATVEKAARVRAHRSETLPG